MAALSEITQLTLDQPGQHNERAPQKEKLQQPGRAVQPATPALERLRQDDYSVS